jgi:hypothetical protein
MRTQAYDGKWTGSILQRKKQTIAKAHGEL